MDRKGQPRAKEEKVEGWECQGRPYKEAVSKHKDKLVKERNGEEH